MKSISTQLTTLTEEDQAQFTDLRRQAKTATEDLGKILADLKKSKLYIIEFGTWENFCNVEFGFSPQYSLRLIASTEIKSETKGSLLENERQARALGTVPPKQRQKVMEAVASSEGPITAAKIEQTAEVILDALEVDCEGFPLPAVTLERWGRRNELKDLMQQVSKIKSRVKEAFEAKEWLGNNINFQSLTADLTNAYSTLKFCMPHAVCTSCNGIRVEKCTFCKGTGLLSEFTWRTVAPVEAKELRKRGIEA